MLKIILRLVMIMSMLSVFVSARNLDYTSGWQMKGFGGYSADIDPETFLYGNSHVKYMWAYQNGSWHVGYIHEVGTGTSSIPAITSITNNEGFWIKTDNVGTLSIPIMDSTQTSQSDMSIKSGWNMYGYDKPISSLTFNNPHVKIVWSYDPLTSKWSAYSSDSTMQSLITDSGIATITTINENEGFWVNADSAVELNIISPDAPQLRDTAMTVLERNSTDSIGFGHVDFIDKGTGNITGFSLIGEGNDTFKTWSSGSLSVAKPDLIDFSKKAIYRFKIQAHSTKGDSNIANLYVYVSPKPTKHLVASDAKEYDFAGDVLALENDDLLVGAYKADANSYDDGKIYRYSQLSMENSIETSFQEAYPSAKDYFGNAIATSGAYLAVGVPGRRDSPYSKVGTVFIEKLQADGSYKQLQELNVNNSFQNQKFGQSLAMSGDNLLIGSASRRDPNVYWYQKNAYGNFVYKDTITPLDANVSLDFGEQIVISGDYFAISSSPNNSKVYYYKFTADGYQLLTTLQKEIGFGYKMSMDDPYLLIGAVDGKQAYLFKRSDENLTQMATVQPEIGFGKNYSFGGSGLAIKGKVFAIGASGEGAANDSEGTGSVYLYNIDTNDTVTLKAKLRHPYLEQGASYGAGIALSKNYLAVGASREDMDKNNTYMHGTGGVYVYHINTTIPKIFNMPDTIVYAEGSDRTQLYQFQPSETVSYELSGPNATLFSINAQNNMLEANQDMLYTENNNTFALTITIKTSDARVKTYHTTVVLALIFHGLNYKTVTSPFTGRVWLDRNIGATEVCDSTKSDMSGCYGEYFQWGRGFDGHEKIDSNTSDTKVTNLNNSGSDFITTNYYAGDDWVAVGVDDDGSLRKKIWSKTDGSSVCPKGFRVPTIAEFKAETTLSSAGLRNFEDAINNFLKLPAAALRDYQNGIMAFQGEGFLWTTDITVLGPVDDKVNNDLTLAFGNDYGSMVYLAFDCGASVRCIKDK